MCHLTIYYSIELQCVAIIRVYTTIWTQCLTQYPYPSAGAVLLLHTPPSSDTTMRQLGRSKRLPVVWVCTSPEAHRVPNISRWESVVLLYWGERERYDSSRPGSGDIIVVASRCFTECLVQARNHYYCSNRCCGLRNNAIDVRPTNAAGVKPTKVTP